MKINILNKLFILGIIFSFVIVSTVPVVSNTVEESKIYKIEEYLTKLDCKKEYQYELKCALNSNESSKYYIFSAGVFANSYFVKMPRLFTQRGIIFAAQIRYKLPPAFTIVFEKNNKTGIKLMTVERGNHRVILFGFGHSGFTRPHFFSFGKIVAISRIKPIVF